MAAPARPLAPGGNCRSVAFYAHKGGVGKSTLIFDVAHQLSTVHGQHVVIIDADSQLNTTFKLLKRRQAEIQQSMISDLLVQQYNGLINVPNGGAVPTLLNFLSGPTDFAMNHLVTVPACNNRVRLLLGSPKLHEAENGIVTGMQVHAIPALLSMPTLFRRLLTQIYAAFEGNVVILVDMSPNSNLMNQNLLLSCDYFILPCNADDNSMMSQMLLLQYLPLWRTNPACHHVNYLQHDVKLLFTVMNRYKASAVNHAAGTQSEGTGMVRKYIGKSQAMLDEFIASPANARFLLADEVHFHPNRLLKVQNGMRHSEVISEHFISMFELKQRHCKDSATLIDKDKVRAICSEITDIVTELRGCMAGVPVQAQAPAAAAPQQAAAAAPAAAAAAAPADEDDEDDEPMQH